MAESASVDPFPVQGGGWGKTARGASLHIASLESKAPWTGGDERSGAGIAKHSVGPDAF